MYKIILSLLLALSLQGFVSLDKYEDQNTTKECYYLKEASIKNAKKAMTANSHEQAVQYRDIADNLYEQNHRCVTGTKQRVYGAKSQFTK